RGVRVLHAAATRAAGKVIEERVSIVGAVVHPTSRSGDNFVQRGDEFFHVVVGGIGVDDDAIVAAGLVEIGFGEVADFDGRINQAVVIRGREVGVVGLSILR